MNGSNGEWFLMGIIISIMYSAFQRSKNPHISETAEESHFLPTDKEVLLLDKEVSKKSDSNHPAYKMIIDKARDAGVPDKR